mgnify:CR=1 FL=1
MRLAEQYIQAFGNLAKEGTTLMLPSNVNDPSAMVAQAMGIFSTLNKSATTPNSSNPTSEEITESAEETAEEEWPSESTRRDKLSSKKDME